MLAKGIFKLSPRLFMLLAVDLSLLHQLLAYALCLLHIQREISHFIEYTVFQFLWQLLEHSVFVDLLGPPVALLRRDVGCGRDLDVGINEEQRQQFAVSGFVLVCELERQDAVLEYVRKNEQATFTGQNFT